jgi:transposase, IS5 family
MAGAGRGSAAVLPERRWPRPSTDAPGAHLRMYIAQQCFGLSDEGIEDAIYDSQSIRGFVGIDLTHESAPDATTLLKFRRLLEKHNLTRRIFDEINVHLASKGLVMREGTIVDATLIAAPPSTKNHDKERDPEMHQSKKGNDWHFGMKAHVDVDMATGLVHSVVGTAGNVSDVVQAHAREKLENAKASVRAKVEHCFHVVKCLFKHRKTRYRGLEKNNAQLFTLFGFANLILARWFLGSAHAQVVS